jgi:hypothetical protein
MVALKWVAILYLISPVEIELPEQVWQQPCKDSGYNLYWAMKDVAEDAGLQDVWEYTYGTVSRPHEAWLRLRHMDGLPSEDMLLLMPAEAYVRDTITFQSEFRAYVLKRRELDWQFRHEYYDTVLEELDDSQRVYRYLYYSGIYSTAKWARRKALVEVLNTMPDIYAGLPDPVPLWCLKTMR